jgi:TonB family protein
MKPIILALIVACCGIRSWSQQQYFEGTLVYHAAIKSKVDILDDEDVRKILASGEVLTVTCKNGNYRETNAYSDEITIARDKKVYIKFPKLDTLYYIDFPPDTAAPGNIVKTDSIFKVNNYSCKGITISSANVIKRYYYTEALRNNLVFDKENTVGQYNVYARETGGSVFLWLRSEYSVGVITDSCIRIEQKSIDDHAFDLPALPVKKFDPSSLQSGPRYPGKAEGWLRYLQSNLDSKVSLKYVRLAKDQQEASVTVQVKFSVGKDGSVSNIQVLNKNDVHPKLAEEAVRVIQESSRWIPAQFYGQKINGAVRQPVVFKVTR